MKPVIYQVLVRLFGNTKTGVRINGTREENGCGKFDDINEAALAALKNFGITHIWYTGVLEHAVAADYSRFGIANDYPEIIKGRAGSPYAVKDCFDVSPDLAINVPDRMDEFQALVRRTHDAGMKVIMDFVPNHLARVYSSDIPEGNQGFGNNDDTSLPFSPQNDFYYLAGRELELPDELYRYASGIEYRETPVKYVENPAKATGNDCFRPDPGVWDWYETVKLNYGVDYLDGKREHFEEAMPPVWEKMRSVILYWAGKNIDGFRADMAEMVPAAFWKWLINSVKAQYPDLIFIAEIYQPALYHDYVNAGFDWLYDKVDFYEAVRNILEKKSGTDEITKSWQKTEGLEKHMLRFLENHDEQRIASRFFAGDPWRAIPGIVLAATMNQGPLMVYFGQEVGEPAEGESGYSSDDGRTTIFDYWNVPRHQQWMSNGRFDGEMLPEELRELRRNYEGIIRLCRKYPVFSADGFYDLMWVNRHAGMETEGRIFAFLRYLEQEAALVILNFSHLPVRRHPIFIPDDAFSLMNISGRIQTGSIKVFPEASVTEASCYPLNGNHFDFNLPSDSAVIVFFSARS